MQRRRKRYEEPLFYKWWELPQGKLERGESLVECANRELSEETGLKLERVNDINQVSRKADDTESCKPLICVRTFGETDFLGLALLISATGEPVLKDIRRDFKWVSKEGLRTLLDEEDFFPLNRAMLNEYLSI